MGMDIGNGHQLLIFQEVKQEVFFSPPWAKKGLKIKINMLNFQMENDS